MGAMTITDIPDHLVEALKSRAARKGSSEEAEALDLLERGLASDGDLKIGAALAALGRKYGGIELNIERDRTPWKPVDFD